MNGQEQTCLYWSAIIVGNISRQYRVGHGSVTCQSLFLYLVDIFPPKDVICSAALLFLNTKALTESGPELL